MLKILGINSEKCIKCEKCVQSCSVELFSVERFKNMGKKIVFDDPLRFCFRCGHCIAICPTEAILFEGTEAPYDFKGEKKPSSILSYEDYMNFTRSRRSIRKFKDKPVKEGDIEKIIQAMRYSPSASNRQNRNYIILTNSDDIAFLSDRVSLLMKRTKQLLFLRYLLVPFVGGMLRRRILSKKTKVRLRLFFEEKEAGKDNIFFKAPCVIIVHAPPYSKMTASDVAIAVTHGMLAAHSLGLGTCWIGFAQEHLWRNKKSRKWLGIPKQNNVYGVFIVGHSDLTYVRAPPRREARVEWKK